MTHQCPTCKREFATAKGQREHARRAGHAPMPSKQLRRLLAEDPTCTWCGGAVDPTLAFGHRLIGTREHMVARADGGTSLDENIQLAHWICNHLRGTMAEEGFRALMRGEAVTREQLWPELAKLLEPPKPKRKRTGRKRTRPPTRPGSTGATGR